MLKNISNLGSVLSRADQKAVKGGDGTLLCTALCGPGDGNVPIYDENPITGFPEEVGCFCV
jgi:hypothetical protein